MLFDCGNDLAREGEMRLFLLPQRVKPPDGLLCRQDYDVGGQPRLNPRLPARVGRGKKVGPPQRHLYLFPAPPILDDPAFGTVRADAQPDANLAQRLNQNRPYPTSQDWDSALLRSRAGKKSVRIPRQSALIANRCFYRFGVIKIPTVIF